MPVSSSDNSFSLGETLLLLSFLGFFLQPNSAFAVTSPSPSDTSDKSQRVKHEANDDGDKQRGRPWQLRIRESGL